VCPSRSSLALAPVRPISIVVAAVITDLLKWGDPR
jgi:hypothetical protein